MAQELVVGYNPLPAAERVAHYQGLVRSRLIWLGIGVVLLLGMWFWLRDQLDTARRSGCSSSALGSPASGW